MLEANCSDEPNQTPSALFPDTHISLSLSEAAVHILICSLRQISVCVSSDVTQIINFDFKSRRAPTDIHFIVCVHGSPAVGGQSRLCVKRGYSKSACTHKSGTSR